MAERQDALVAASQLTLAVREAVTRVPGRQVGTVGQLDVVPNAPNVIPGTVRMTIELRDLSSREAARHHRDIRARAPQIATTTQTTDRDRGSQPQSAGARAPKMQRAIERAASVARPVDACACRAAPATTRR